MGKRANEKKTTTREIYVQQNFLKGGINLEDLRDLVAATQDYDPKSHVDLYSNRIKITEELSTRWVNKGTDED